MELMLAAVILAATLVGLLGTFTGSLRLIESSRNLTIAINHAQCAMEEIRDCNIPSFITDITEGEWTTWAQSDPPDGRSCNSLNDENIQITYPAGEEASPLEIVVTVSWTEKTRLRNVQLATLLTER